jgi:hypothetical protein
METKTSRVYQLDAPLEVLHAESREWMTELHFMKDESAFFYKLIEKRESSDKARNLADAHRQLINLSNERLDKLIVDTESHERVLADVLKKNLSDEKAYRYSHHEISRRIKELNSDMKNLKRNLFSSLID